MKNYEWIDHTADVGVRVYGQDLKEIFINAASAMFELLATTEKDLSKINPREIKVRLDSLNAEALLISWLSELNFLSDTRRLILKKFDIKKISSRHLEASVTGFPRRYFSVGTEIKAVTYHGLKIQKENDRYSTQIIFDV